MVTQDIPIKAARLTGYERITENMKNHPKSSALKIAAEGKSIINLLLRFIWEKSYIDTYLSFLSEHANNAEYDLSHSLIS